MSEKYTVLKEDINAAVERYSRDFSAATAEQKDFILSRMGATERASFLISSKPCSYRGCKNYV